MLLQTIKFVWYTLESRPW